MRWCSYVLILCPVVSYLGVKLFAQAQEWQNDWDQPLDFKCPDGHGISRVMSEHSNSKEDRRWAFECKPLPQDLGPITCMQTGFINEYDQEFLFEDPFWLVMSGAHSVHNNGNEDRRWDLYMCGVIGVYCPYYGYWTDEVNAYDEYMDFMVPDGFYIVGVWSHHDNGKEDRVWKFLVAQIGPC